MAVTVGSSPRASQGSLVMAAEAVTPEAVNFMATEARGLICVPMLEGRLDQLGIPPIASGPGRFDAAIRVGVDHRSGTTGVSAADRAATIGALAASASRRSDFSVPGHVFPIACRREGVLERAGHAEAAFDLVRIAGRGDAAVVCEIASANGEMARDRELRAFSERFDLPLVSVADLIRYERHESRTERVAESWLPLDGGDYRVVAYRDRRSGIEHVAVILGDPVSVEAPLVRLHSECLTGDVLGSRRCDCGRQLEAALSMIESEGVGALIYLRGHEGRGIGLAEKIRAYALQDRGQDTVEANRSLGHPVDGRDYRSGVQILVDLGVRRLRLLTNNPTKRAGLEGFGLEVVDRVPIATVPTPESRWYLQVKREKLGHLPVE